MKQLINHSYHKTLKEIADVIIAPEENFYTLTKAIESWKKILMRITALNLSAESNRESIHSETGKAIGTTWAAMCLDDLLRTRRFIRGVFQAVEDCLAKDKKEAIQILYAGSGPFAPLVLLLTTKFSSEAVQFTLLEVNENSVESVKKVFNALKLTDYIHDIHHCDATTFQLPNGGDIDIVISETMQHALVREQQVPITFNVLSQVNKETILIPEKIELQLGLLNQKRDNERMLSGNNDIVYYHLFGAFFELSKSAVFTQKDVFASFCSCYRFPEITFSLAKKSIKNFDCLSVFTKIIIYGDEQLDVNESPLTLPLMLKILDENTATTVKVNYKVDATPGIEYKLE